MERSRRLAALLVALIAPTIVLAAFGVRSLVEGIDGARERYAAQSNGALATIERALERRVEALAAGRGPLPVAFATDGRWLGELGAADDTTEGDPVLRASLAREIDDLQARGELDSAIERASLASAHEDPTLAAWALSTRAALERIDGRDEAWRGTLRELVERHPDRRDERGLPRSLAARLELALETPQPCDDLLAIQSDAIELHRSHDQVALAALIARVRAEVDSACSDPAFTARVAALERRDAELADQRALLAAIPRGIADWIARGAPGGAELFDAPAAPIELGGPLRASSRLVVAVASVGDELRGSAIGADRAVELALAEVSAEPTFASLALRPAVVDDRGRAVGSAIDDASPIARRALAEPFAGWSIELRGGDSEAFVARERKRAWTIAALIAAATVVAFGGAWFAWRGLRRELEAARARESFVAAVTHELKTPVASIRLFAEMLAGGGVEPATVREFGARTVQQSDRLTRLVDSVLELARIEHGGNGAARSSIDLAELVEHARATFDPVARSKGFSIATRAPSERVIVRGDPDALGGALLDLLDNALKYGDAPHAIEIELSTDGDGHAQLAVLDRGRGVPREDAERIFEPFERLGDELVRDRPGVGLGLALVRRIARAHGGDARCEARQGGGSRFVLELPIEKETAA